MRKITWKHHEQTQMHSKGKLMHWYHYPHLYSLSANPSHSPLKFNNPTNSPSLC
jgi:hypothetical protein